MSIRCIVYRLTYCFRGNQLRARKRLYIMTACNINRMPQSKTYHDKSIHVQGESKKTDTFVIHLNIKCISFFWLTLYNSRHSKTPFMVNVLSLFCFPWQLTEICMQDAEKLKELIRNRSPLRDCPTDRNLAKYATKSRKKRERNVFCRQSNRSSQCQWEHAYHGS
jgi:hypothetical protein